MAEPAAGEPTEEPTPQRLLKARQRGEVAVSRDLSATIGFGALVAVLAGTAPWGVARVLPFFRHVLATAPAGGAAGTPAIPALAAQIFASCLMLPLGVALAAGILVTMMQTRGLFAWQAARPDLGRASPTRGLKRIFGTQTVVEMVKGGVKLALVLAVAVTTMGRDGRNLVAVTGAGPAAVLTAMGVLSARLASRVVLALVGLAVIDWLLVNRRHRRKLMMTREEVKREHKESEGDPRHRSERQRLHRELTEQRMIEDVRKADFIVVNPEHIAVAVKYDRAGDAAPQVVAKGERLLAERIKQVAREAGVPIYRDVSLARALSELPEGEEIPEALYEAVAELLRVLWEIEERDRGGQGASAGSTGAPANRDPDRNEPMPSAAPALAAARAPASSSWKRV